MMEAGLSLPPSIRHRTMQPWLCPVSSLHPLPLCAAEPPSAGFTLKSVAGAAGQGRPSKASTAPKGFLQWYSSCSSPNQVLSPEVSIRVSVCLHTEFSCYHAESCTRSTHLHLALRRADEA